MKKQAIITSIILIIIIIAATTLFFYNKALTTEISHKAEMNSSFSETMIVKKEATLYKREGQKYYPSGKITKGVSLYLKYEKVNTKNDRYYKVEDSPYYIDYTYLEKIEGIPILENIYIPFAEEVITKDNHTLILLDNTDLSQIYVPNTNRYQIVTKEKDKTIILFQNRLWSINNIDIEKTEYLNTEIIESSTNLSVILLTKADKVKVELLISSLKENQTIKLEDYKKWAMEEVRLRKGTILLLTDDENIHQQINNANLISNLIKNTSSEWSLNNLQSKQKEEKPSVYIWTSTSTTEDITTILNGGKINTNTTPTASPYAISVPVLNYHFFYDGTNGNPCKENICLDSRKLEEHLKYLRDNNFKTLTIEEYREWMYGKINLPKKSVLITIDDGAMGTSKINGNILIPMLEKYKMNATLFLITAWWDKNNYESSYLDIESHGYDIHTRATCNEKKTSKGACLSKDELKQDLNKSIDILGTKTAFCYPFYISTDSMIESIKETGFYLGFVGGNRKSTRTNNKYKIPRYPIYETTTMEQFKKIVN